MRHKIRSREFRTRLKVTRQAKRTQRRAASRLKRAGKIARFWCSSESEPHRKKRRQRYPRNLARENVNPQSYTRKHCTASRLTSIRRMCDCVSYRISLPSACQKHSIADRGDALGSGTGITWTGIERKRNMRGT